ncbi:phosphatase PAP2 family protein [Priestia filamentosa]|uniref:phosphatase PAP2 family protein n=1 Tax=Priestia filamentosa TaxID=1402861 RepID=UPI001FB4156F|nr:phosphatase PAP2 family protein [Priestia filamentosa]MED3727587.1 phosphatase PAP2 family protein [Priestia filamentosa]UOE58309.1 phosphatase PAP2 family protein [Priestia filamentosa]
MMLKQFTSSTQRFIMYAFCMLFFSIFIFWKFADTLVEEELHTFDITIIDWIQSFISDKLTKILETLTFLGSAKAVIAISILIIILMLFNKKWWETLFFVVAVLGSSLFNLLLKFIFQRTRPSIHPLITETGYSFPSGHSMVSFVLYGMITYFLVLFYVKRFVKIITILFFSLLVLLIGISRIYLGVHYPSDVLAGFAVGGTWLIICLIVLKIILENRQGNME